MVLAEEMSSGRTTPATVSWRTSVLVRTSWVPWITRLPLGRTAETTAAMVRLIFSARFTEPAPALVVLELVDRALAGSKPPGRILPRLDSRPSRCGMPAVTPAVRELAVVLVVLALSSISICTVRMSPILPARWSIKNARAPERHRELALAGVGAFTLMIRWSMGARAAG